jgi:hypothetical protein
MGARAFALGIAKSTIEQCGNVDGEENYGFWSLSISTLTGATS